MDKKASVVIGVLAFCALFLVLAPSASADSPYDYSRFLDRLSLSDRFLRMFDSPVQVYDASAGGYNIAVYNPISRTWYSATCSPNPKAPSFKCPTPFEDFLFFQMFFGMDFPHTHGLSTGKFGR